MTDWLILTATLPTSPSALRVRIWRALKAIGCVSLREGVYLLPAHAPSAPALWEVEASILQARAQAHMLSLQARDGKQEAAFIALFDRSAPYQELLRALKETRTLLKKGADAPLRKALQSVEQQFLDIEAIDFFPGPARERAGAALATLRQDIEQHLAPGEPHASHSAIQRQPLAAYQGKTWATRKRPWVDRLATAWLVKRFVDPAARFQWIATPAQCPKRAIGFDFDGATFSHVGDKVTFEVVMHTFGLQTDAALKRLGELVHYIDIGGIPVDEAPGLETLMRGLQAQHARDDDLLTASLAIFDALYVALRAAP